jgi:peroxiredoxin
MSATRLIQSLMLVVAISGCRHGEKTPDGDILAALTAPSVDDKPFDATQFRGKPTILMFASPSCGYCAKELPIAHSVASAEGANMAVVYVSGGKEAASKAAKRGGFNGTVLVDNGTLRDKYGIKGVPYTLILKADGTADTAFRGMQEESDLRSALASAK